MNLQEIKAELKTEKYNFLTDDEHLGNNIVLLGLGGSHAYGMELPGSDLDVRGISLNRKEGILLGYDFEQVVETNTDTTIYSFNKMLDLLSKNNPNTIEIIGLKPEHYLYLSDIGKELLNNRHMFLSKLCVNSFGGYAQAQFRRMSNKAARLVGQEENERFILKSIDNAMYDLRERHYPYNDGGIKLYVDNAVTPGYNSEVFIDTDLKHYPLRDFTGLWSELKSITTSYKKFGKRNEKAVSHDKLGKHCAHLLRLYMMCIDILEREEVITYREKEHDLLMKVRNGEYLDSNRQPVSAFYDLVDECEKRFEYAKQNTSLPDYPDYKKINEFKVYVNERIVKGEV